MNASIEPPEWAPVVIRRALDLTPGARTALKTDAGARTYRHAGIRADRAFKKVVNGLPMNRWDWDPAWTITILCAQHPTLHAPRPDGLTIPAAIRRLPISPTSQDRLLGGLLACDRPTMLQRIPSVCSRIAAAGLHLDLYRLASDLTGWGQQSTKRAWAADAWPTNTKNNPPVMAGD
ncbi:MAG: type I-E CRISPR-associated protein Cse2/CasB [Mycobacterium sp.]|nr:type I-E CRISPR-associated protein Cse2/CasB [Mycobacterium sp.]